MSVLPHSTDLITFTTALLAVCVPTYLLILVLGFMDAPIRSVKRVWKRLGTESRRSRAGEDIEKREET